MNKKEIPTARPSRIHDKVGTIVISLGRSLVAPASPQGGPAGIDSEFLKNFKKCLEKLLGKRQFFILVGGGKICRIYQKALLEFGAKSIDRDWIGINISRLNAEVVKQVFTENCYPKVITELNKKVKTTKNIVVGAGWRPGHSTDYDAVLAAKNQNAEVIVNLSNIDYVYDKDPTQFSDAKPIEKIDWRGFEKIVGSKWVPGLSKPFDPIASKLAAKLKLKVVLINGKHLERLEDFFNNKPFIGTVIQ